MLVRIPSGPSFCEADIPEENLIGVFAPSLPPPAPDPLVEADRALDAPSGSPNSAVKAASMSRRHASYVARSPPYGSAISTGRANIFSAYSGNAEISAVWCRRDMA